MGGLNGFMLALIATLWAYDGWSDLSMVAGEVRAPGTQPSHCPHRRPAGGGRALHGHQCGNSICSAGVGDRRFCHLPAVTRSHSGGRAARRRNRCRGHGFSIFVGAQRHDHVGRARSLCRRARWAVFPQLRTNPSAISVAFHFAGGAGAALHGVAAVLEPVSATVRSDGVRRMAVLHAGGQHGLCIPAQAARCAPALQGMGISGASGHLCGLRRGGAGFKLCRKSEGSLHRYRI